MRWLLRPNYLGITVANAEQNLGGCGDNSHISDPDSISTIVRGNHPEHFSVYRLGKNDYVMVEPRAAGAIKVISVLVARDC